MLNPQINMSFTFSFTFRKILFIHFREREGGKEGKRERKMEKGRDRGKETSTCCSTYLCIHWLIPTCAPVGTKPATLVHLDDTTTN